MARSQKEAVVIVLDVGKLATEDCDAEGTSFFEKSRACVSLILQRKVFSESKDEVGVVLMGTEDTANSLDYQHIRVLAGLQVVNWEMIEAVEGLTKTSAASAGWLDAVVVALDLLHHHTNGKKSTQLKLALLSNLASECDPEQVDVVIQSFKDLNVNLVVIGPDLDQHYPKSPGKEIMNRIVTEVGAVVSNFQDALEQLMFFQNKTVRPVAWNADLQIGSTIKIPVSGYRKISSTSLPSWKTSVSGGDQPAVLHKEVSYFKDDELQTEVQRSSIISGYLFGSTIVPIADEDEAAMGYQSGPRSLSVLGFTQRATIQRHYLTGDSTYYFVARKGNQAAAEALCALTQALEDLDMVAVVRKVYNYGNAPCMGVLFPKCRPSSQVLVFAQLPFSEDMREFIFPALPRAAKEGEEKTAAVDQLIDAMFLGEDLLQPETLLDSHRQHWYSCLSHRALRPSEPLPSLAPHLAAALRCPVFEDHRHLADTLSQELERLFPLQQVVAPPARRPAHSIFKQEADGAEMSTDVEVKPLVDQLARDVVEVGTLRPADDFLALLKQGEPFPVVCEQMTAVVERLVTCSFGQDDYGKAVEAMRTLRGKCREVNPQPYNQWLPQLRKMLLDNHKVAFLELIKAELGPISSEENPSSSVSALDAGRFFQEDVADHGAAAAGGEVDEEDLFDQM